jgi:hypothetical protein
MVRSARMESEKIRIELLPGVDDAPLRSSEYQQALRDFEQSLRESGFTPSIGLKFLDATAGVSPAVYNGAFTIAVGALPVIGGLVGAWLKGRYGRKVRLEIGKNGEIKAEAQTVEQVDELVKMAHKKPRKTGHA